MVNTANMDAAIALSRFGMGARPGELEAVRTDPQGWLAAQTSGPVAQPEGQFASGGERLAQFGAFRRAREQAKSSGAAPAGAGPADVKAMGEAIRQDIGAEFLARARLSCVTAKGFAERWRLFWCNHFTTSATKELTAVLVGDFERRAIRPHTFGRFQDMLTASTRHPAMLSYLDQQQSFGPDSLAGQRRNLGLNENLAREIMELHTLGVGAYDQADVTEFARALTGWSFVGPNEMSRPHPLMIAQSPDAQPGDFVFRAYAHQAGVRTILRKTYAEAGEDQAAAALRDFALAPATARHIALKLGRHFVADDPPPALTARLAHSFMASEGDLGQVARTLIASPEAWSPQPKKFKTPYEFLVSSYRAMGDQPEDIKPLAQTLTLMGQKPFSAPSPKGWPEETGDWASPDAIMKRMSWAEQYAARTAPPAQPAELAENALGARLSAPVRAAVARAESRPEAVAILLMSPEFQRR
ncbi:MAG: DUF1800 family protein [Caulobacteraceae bacterium]|nr:DUF1800 family protein [Caulobacteraceae bacterium]